MARTGVFQVPHELNDIDKWFKFFTRKQAVVIGITLFIDYRIIMYSSTVDLLLPAIILCCVFTLSVAGIIMVQLPIDSLFLNGGGITIDQLLVRLFIHSRNKKIYAKNYEAEDYEEQIKE